MTCPYIHYHGMGGWYGTLVLTRPHRGPVVLVHTYLLFLPSSLFFSGCFTHSPVKCGAHGRGSRGARRGSGSRWYLGTQSRCYIPATLPAAVRACDVACLGWGRPFLGGRTGRVPTSRVCVCVGRLSLGLFSRERGRGDGCHPERVARGCGCCRRPCWVSQNQATSTSRWQRVRGSV